MKLLLETRAVNKYLQSHYRIEEVAQLPPDYRDLIVFLSKELDLPNKDD